MTARTFDGVFDNPPDQVAALLIDEIEQSCEEWKVGDYRQFLMDLANSVATELDATNQSIARLARPRK